MIGALGQDKVYDVAVVGCGPAGLRPRSMRRPRACRWWCCDARAFGGQAGASARIENYLGFPTGISGQALTGARLQPGAEVRRRHHDSGRGEVARLRAQRRRLRA